MAAEAAWHPDPFGEASWRLSNGGAWTEQTAPARETPDLAPIAVAFGKSVMLDQESGGTDVFKCDEIPVGLLHFPTFGDPTAETAAGAWHFDLRGVMTGRVHVFVQPANQEIGQFLWEGIGTGTDGTLHFPDGRWFRLARATQLAQEGVVSPADYDPSHQIWVWYGPDRAAVATVRLAIRLKTKTVFGKEFTYTSSSTGKTGSDIWTDMHEPAASVRELPVLMTLATAMIWSHTARREAMRRDRL
jgi:hypothetical protein